MSGSIRIGVVEGSERTQLISKVKELLPTKPADKRRAVIEMIQGMPYMGISISPDNMKLGSIMNFSLPAGQNFRGATCPGASELCEKICYALKGYIQFQEYAYYVNWAYALLWPERFFKAFTQARLSPVFRVHVGGDFFEPWYLELWSNIARRRDDVRFFAYTRSWQNGEGRIAKRFIAPLNTFSQLKNVRLVLSADRETGIPDVDLIPGAIRAWLAVDDKDMPPEPVELIFRHKRPSTMSTFPPDRTSEEETTPHIDINQETATPVCPYERLKRTKKGKMLKEGAVTCQNCAWCYGAGHAAYGRREEDLPRFDMWAGANLENRVSGMFRQFVPWRKRTSPNMGAPQTEAEICVCGAEVPCLKCGLCIGCLCECP